MLRQTRHANSTLATPGMEVPTNGTAHGAV